MSEEPKNKKLIVFMRLLRIVIFCLALVTVLIMLPSIMEENTDFLVFTTDCDNFSVTGIITNEENKLYLSRAKFCGGSHPTEYLRMEARLYLDNEVIGNYRAQNIEGIVLAEFLSEISFEIDNLTKMCGEVDLFLRVLGTNQRGHTIGHPIELINEINCHN